MFDFIKPERHSFLKKILGIGTLLGVLLGTIKELLDEKAAGAGFFAFCSLFVFVWLLDVFKDGVSEVFEAVDKAETTAFSSKKAFTVDLQAPLSADLVKKVRQQMKSGTSGLHYTKNCLVPSSGCRHDSADQTLGR